MKKTSYYNVYGFYSNTQGFRYMDYITLIDISDCHVKL